MRVEGVTRRTAQSYALETLRSAILDGQLSPGTQLVQASLAEQLGVSTTPVREALRDLAAEGLVHLDAHRGAIVRGIDFGECREVYEMRMLLEPHALRRSLPALDDATLQRALDHHHAMEQTDDPRHWAELNREFHRLLTSGAPSRHLQEILQRLQGASEAYVGISLRVAPAQMRQGSADHEDLLAAARDRDADRASEVIVQHLRSTLEEVERAHRNPTESQTSNRGAPRLEP